jgi:hypothetical protein
VLIALSLAEGHPESRFFVFKTDVALITASLLASRFPNGLPGEFAGLACFFKFSPPPPPLFSLAPSPKSSQISHLDKRILNLDILSFDFESSLKE